MSIRQGMKWAALAAAGVALSGCVAAQPIGYADGYGQPVYSDAAPVYGEPVYTDGAPAYYDAGPTATYYDPGYVEPYYAPAYPVVGTSVYYNVYNDRSRRNDRRRFKNKSNKRLERQIENRGSRRTNRRVARQVALDNGLTPAEVRASRQAVRQERLDNLSPAQRERRLRRIENRQVRRASAREEIPNNNRRKRRIIPVESEQPPVQKIWSLSRDGGNN